METAFAGVLGAMIGSFLNVVTHRVPRRLSIVAPSSRCVSCSTPIKPYDNIPVLSYLLLRGHCRHCRASISPRYPLIEAGTAGLCAAVVADRSGAAGIALGVAMVLLLVPLAFIDLEHRRLPNAITLPGCALAVILGSALDPAGEPTRLIAGAGAGGALLLAALAHPGGMGMGDVKLAAMIGLFLGKPVIPAILIALICGVLVGGVVIARRGVKDGRRTAIPFGPFLAFGAVLALFAGSEILHWYSTTFLH